MVIKMGEYTVVSRKLRWKMRLAFSGCALLFASYAHAACPATNQYNFSFSSQTAANLSYASTYNYTATSTALGNQNFSMAFATNGLATSVVSTATAPAISTLITDGVATQNLLIGGRFNARTNAAFTTNVVTTTFTFPVPIRDFTVQVNDIDYTLNQFRDWVQFTGFNGAASYVPTLSTPFGTNNGAGPRTVGTSSMVVGNATTPVTVTTSEAAGTGASGNNANTGTITASFLQPVTSVQMKWGNYPLQAGDTVTGVQAIGIQQVSWCPMPAMSIAKSTTPATTVLTDPNRFNIPGADVNYTLTVTNTGGSPLDLNSTILSDILPPQTTFFNGDIDTVNGGTQNYIFNAGTSGLTMAPANITYSNNGGTSYGYTPAAGYDANMQALRLNPQGTMAPNSSFTITFRTAVK